MLSIEVEETQLHLNKQKKSITGSSRCSWSDGSARLLLWLSQLTPPGGDSSQYSLSRLRNPSDQRECYLSRSEQSSRMEWVVCWTPGLQQVM